MGGGATHNHNDHTCDALAQEHVEQQLSVGPAGSDTRGIQFIRLGGTSREAKSAATHAKSSLTASAESFIGPPDLSSPDTPTYTRDVDQRQAHLPRRARREGGLAGGAMASGTPRLRAGPLACPDGTQLVALVRAGARFEKGELAKRPAESRRGSTSRGMPITEVDDLSALALYHAKRLASPAQRIMLYANSCQVCAPYSRTGFDLRRSDAIRRDRAVSLFPYTIRCCSNQRTAGMIARMKVTERLSGWYQGWNQAKYLSRFERRLNRSLWALLAIALVYAVLQHVVLGECI